MDPVTFGEDRLAFDPSLFKILAKLSEREVKQIIKDSWSFKSSLDRSMLSKLTEDQLKFVRRWLVHFIIRRRPNLVAYDIYAWRKWIAFALKKLPVLLELSSPNPTYGEIVYLMSQNSLALQILISGNLDDFITKSSVIWDFRGHDKNQESNIDPVMSALIQEIQFGSIKNGKHNFAMPTERNIENWIAKQEEAFIPDFLAILVAQSIAFYLAQLDILGNCSPIMELQKYCLDGEQMFPSPPNVRAIIAGAEFKQAFLLMEIFSSITSKFVVIIDVLLLFLVWFGQISSVAFFICVALSPLVVVVPIEQVSSKVYSKLLSELAIIRHLLSS